MEMKKNNLTFVVYQAILLATLLLPVHSCSLIDEKYEAPVYLFSTYLNAQGVENYENISSATDFFFRSADSVLVAVERVTGSDILKRRLSLPEGDYIITRWCNINGRTSVAYEIGKTKFRDLSVAITHSSYYSQKGQDKVNPPFDNSDAYYYGKVDASISSDGGGQRIDLPLSNAHMWLILHIKWNSDESVKGGINVTLSDVPAGYGFNCEERLDPHHNVSYQIPYVFNNTFTSLTGSRIDVGNGKYIVSMRTLRWSNDHRPILRIYNGAGELVQNKDLDFTKYLNNNNVVVEDMRVQYLELNISVENNQIIFSPINSFDWDDGGTLNW